VDVKRLTPAVKAAVGRTLAADLAKIAAVPSSAVQDLSGVSGRVSLSAGSRQAVGGRSLLRQGCLVAQSRIPAPLGGSFRDVAAALGRLTARSRIAEDLFFVPGFNKAAVGTVSAEAIRVSVQEQQEVQVDGTAAPTAFSSEHGSMELAGSKEKGLAEVGDTALPATSRSAALPTTVKAPAGRASEQSSATAAPRKEANDLFFGLPLVIVVNGFLSLCMLPFVCFVGLRTCSKVVDKPLRRESYRPLGGHLGFGPELPQARGRPVVQRQPGWTPPSPTSSPASPEVSAQPGTWPPPAGTGAVAGSAATPTLQRPAAVIAPTSGPPTAGGLEADPAQLADGRRGRVVSL